MRKNYILDLQKILQKLWQAGTFNQSGPFQRKPFHKVPNSGLQLLTWQECQSAALERVCLSWRSRPQGWIYHASHLPRKKKPVHRSNPFQSPRLWKTRTAMHMLTLRASVLFCSLGSHPVAFAFSAQKTVYLSDLQLRVWTGNLFKSNIFLVHPKIHSFWIWIFNVLRHWLVADSHHLALFRVPKQSLGDLCSDTVHILISVSLCKGI